MSGIKVSVDQVACVGAGQCVLASPAVFDQREEDGIVVLLVEQPDAALEASVRKAARLCPALAIHVEPA